MSAGYTRLGSRNRHTSHRSSDLHICFRIKWKNIIKLVPCIFVTYLVLSFIIGSPEDPESVGGRSLMMQPGQELYFDIRPNRTDMGHTHVPGIPLRHPHIIFKSKSIIPDISTQITALHTANKSNSTHSKMKLNNYVNPHNFRYLLNTPHLCGEETIFLLTFIHSAPSHYMERMLIRKSWASIEQYGDHKLRTIFLVAKTKDPSDQWKMEEESRVYDDMVQENFLDNYRNLTYKHVMGLKWITNYCHQTKYILKVDDDTYVNIFRVVDFLLSTYSSQPMVNTFYCSLFVNQPAIRDPKDKWFVTKEEYPHDKYPDWCEGFAYIMSSDLVHKLYSASLWTKYFWIDDVYVTGILAAQVGANHSNFHYPYTYGIMKNTHYSNATINEVLFLLMKYQRIPTNTWMRTWAATKKYSSKRTLTLRSYV